MLPPSFGKLPEPGKEIDENIITDKKDTSNIEDLINQSSSANMSENNIAKNSIEESIIKKINLKEAREMNLDEIIVKENEKSKKKKVFLKS